MGLEKHRESLLGRKKFQRCPKTVENNFPYNKNSNAIICWWLFAYASVTLSDICACRK